MVQAVDKGVDNSPVCNLLSSAAGRSVEKINCCQGDDIAERANLRLSVISSPRCAINHCRCLILFSVGFLGYVNYRPQYCDRTSGS